MDQVALTTYLWHYNEAMPDEPAFVRLRLGPQGRLVVPAHFRRALGMEAGDALIASIHDGRLVLEPCGSALERLRSRFAAAAAGVDLAAELLAERREAARREDDEPTP